jgi:predicted TIM-barrel fold metal-dependent hydrolase
VTHDVHQHLWPEPFLGALRARREPPLVRAGELVTVEGVFSFDPGVHDAERRLRELDALGIDVAIVSLQPSLGVEALPQAERDDLEERWLAGTLELVDAAGGRLLAFAPWRVRDGFVGTSVGASVLLGDAPREHVLAEVDARAGLLFVHPDVMAPTPPGHPNWWQWIAGYTGQMQQAYLAWVGGLRGRYPRIRIVFAILAGGAPVQHERLVHRGLDLRTAEDPNTLFDTASYGRNAIELCLAAVGAERLLYGSDTPVVDPRPTLTAVRALDGSAAHLLQTANPARLLT